LENKTTFFKLKGFCGKITLTFKTSIQ